MTQDLPEFDLNGFLPYRMVVAGERLSASFARHYKDEFGLSVPEWRVLVHLAHSGDVSVRDIEARVAMEKSKVSRAASRLQADGYITKTRNDGDKRLVRLKLTEAGLSLMRDLLPRAIEFQKDLESQLSEDMTGLNRALTRIISSD